MNSKRKKTERRLTSLLNEIKKSKNNSEDVKKKNTKRVRLFVDVSILLF